MSDPEEPNKKTRKLEKPCLENARSPVPQDPVFFLTQTEAYASHLAHERVLLGIDEGLEADADGHVDVVALDDGSEVHARVRLAQADH